jgi:hypothetical protein
MAACSFVPSQGSWRISFILAKDLAKGSSFAKNLRRAPDLAAARTWHAPDAGADQPVKSASSHQHLRNLVYMLYLVRPLSIIESVVTNQHVALPISFVRLWSDMGVLCLVSRKRRILLILLDDMSECRRETSSTAFDRCSVLINSRRQTRTRTLRCQGRSRSTSSMPTLSPRRRALARHRNGRKRCPGTLRRRRVGPGASPG